MDGPWWRRRVLRVPFERFLEAQAAHAELAAETAVASAANATPDRAG